MLVKGEVRFACVDGPEFEGLDVDFDNLVDRQSYYKKEEGHECKIGFG